MKESNYCLTEQESILYIQYNNIEKFVILVSKVWNIYNCLLHSVISCLQQSWLIVITKTTFICFYIFHIIFFKLWFLIKYLIFFKFLTYQILFPAIYFEVCSQYFTKVFRKNMITILGQTYGIEGLDNHLKRSSY